MHPSTIFITGATGFIGSWVTKVALHAGYHVRLSVRDEAQIERLATLFSSSRNQLDFVVIQDISEASAFKGRMHGVDYIIHLASPMPGKGDEFKRDYLRPAVDGTTAILHAASASSSVKRVVVTSSMLACIPLGLMNESGIHVHGEPRFPDTSRTYN